MDLNIHFYYHDHSASDNHAEVLDALNRITHQLTRLESKMAKIDEEVAALKIEFDGYVTDVKSDLATLNAKIDALVAAGAAGNPALEALIAEVHDARSTLNGTVADAPVVPPPADEPPTTP